MAGEPLGLTNPEKGKVWKFGGKGGPITRCLP